MTSRTTFCAALLTLLGGAAAAATYDEAVNGDLSNDGLNPSTIVLDAGSNVVRTTTGPFDSDFTDRFALALPGGESLLRIVLVSYDPGPDNATSLFEDCFIAEDCTNANQVGDVLLSASLVGTDLLPLFGGSLDGDYLRIGERNGPARTVFDFQVSGAPVPLPAGLPLLAGGLGLLAWAGRRRAAAA